MQGELFFCEVASFVYSITLLIVVYIRQSAMDVLVGGVMFIV